ncbi:MAG: Cof-type HAD-IIB family hydrolase [Verrucomicrobia bacterium]|nr:Cof-type HAD-IIB family hydrolase [Verrucomicrobiota bacterium]
MALSSSSSRRYRLAAIDLDGTLLGPDHAISPANARAVARMQAAGIEVVLASGRHHSTMHAFARALPGVRWIVSVQGAEVSDVDRARTLHESFLDPAAARQVLALSRELNFPALVYGREGIITDSEVAVETYAKHIGFRPKRVSTDEFLAERTFKIVWVGEPDQLTALAAHAQVAAIPTEKIRSHRHLFEFVQPGVTKATGLVALAAQLGIAREETLAFGDADNDVPMFEWVRTSVAMPHGWPSALARATLVAPAGPAGDALARGVDAVLATAG